MPLDLRLNAFILFVEDKCSFAWWSNFFRILSGIHIHPCSAGSEKKENWSRVIVVIWMRIPTKRIEPWKPVYKRIISAFISRIIIDIWLTFPWEGDRTINAIRTKFDQLIQTNLNIMPFIPLYSVVSSSRYWW